MTIFSRLRTSRTELMASSARSCCMWSSRWKSSSPAAKTAPFEDTLHIALHRSPVTADVEVDVRLLTPEVLGDLRRLATEREIEGVSERVSDVGGDDKRSLTALGAEKRGRGGDTCLSDAAFSRVDDDPRAPAHYRPSLCRECMWKNLLKTDEDRYAADPHAPRCAR